MAGRQIRFDERGSFVQKLTEGRASKGALETFLAIAAAENPNRRLRLMALQDRVSMRVERADFDDLVTLVSQAPTWEKERLAGIRVLLRAIAESRPDAPDQILARWTWRLARATRKVQDRRASTEYPEAKRLLGALANSRGHRHEENAARLVQTALEQPIQVGAALLASAEGYTPRATKLLDDAREKLGGIQEVALALSENLPAPKQPSSTRRRRRRRKKKAAVETPAATAPAAQEQQDEQPATPSKRRRRRRKPSDENGEQGVVEQNGDAEGESPTVMAGGPERDGGEQQHTDAGAELEPAGQPKPGARRQRVAPEQGNENGQSDGERDAADVVGPQFVRSESSELERERDDLE